MSKECFAVHCEAQREEFADRWLRLNMKLETYFPHVKFWTGKSSKQSRLVTKPLLSRYLFVYCGRGDLHRVNDTPGVSTVLYVAGEPIAIPEDIMKELRTRLGEEEGKILGKLPSRRKFDGAVGQKFKFGENSAFFNFVAEISRVLDNERIIARFSEVLFGVAGREVEVSTSDVGVLLTSEDELAHGTALSAVKR